MRSLIYILGLSLVLSGCATSRNYQPDIDSLNSKVNALQKQIMSKDRQIGNLNDKIRNLQTQLEIAKQDKADAEGRLDAALDRLSRKKSSSKASSKASSGYDKYSTEEYVK